MAADLGDVHGVQDRVDLPIPGQIETVTDGVAAALAGGRGDGGGAAPAGDLCLALEPAGVADLGEQVMALTTPIPWMAVSVQPSRVGDL